MEVYHDKLFIVTLFILLHQLKENLKVHWSIKVSGNWRITFKFIEGNVYVVDYTDYH
jgi:proteic killer suppression protein